MKATGCAKTTRCETLAQRRPAVCLVLSLAIGLTMVFGGSARAQGASLWQDGVGASASLYGDHRAKAPGDLLTVIIVEKADASSKATSANNKSAQVDAGPGLGLLNFFPLAKVKGGDQLAAAGTTTRGGSLSAKMTVTVKSVSPGGTLTVEGIQTIVINKETQKILLTGVVRPEDISRDNTVYSTYVADAQITYLGDGVVGDKQQPGILSRIFSWLW